jgi:mRNA interferase MazF
LITIVPLTTSPRPSRFEVSVKAGFLRAGVFDAQNIVTIPKAKVMRKRGVLASEKLVSIEHVVRL